MLKNRSNNNPKEEHRVRKRVTNKKPLIKK